MGMFGILSYISVFIGVYHTYMISGKAFAEWLGSLGLVYIILVAVVVVLITYCFVRQVQYFYNVKK